MSSRYPGDPLCDIGVTQKVGFVMKGGQVYVNDAVNNSANNTVNN
jgi:formylmethanofuran dehydrogenase subunit C